MSGLRFPFDKEEEKEGTADTDRHTDRQREAEVLTGRMTGMRSSGLGFLTE